MRGGEGSHCSCNEGFRLGRIAGYNNNLIYDRMGTITVGLHDTNQHETFGREYISLSDKLTVGGNVIDVKLAIQLSR